MIKLTILGQTPTINHLYGHNNYGGFYMKTEAKKIRAQIIHDVQIQAGKQNFKREDWGVRLLKIKVTIYEDWFTLKDTVKKKDIANREKFLIDSIMEALEMDDQYIWEHTMIKKVEPKKENYRAEIELSFFKP